MITKVKLRKKNITGGRLSLYLDFYPPIPDPLNGKSTRREFLKTFIFESPKGTLEKQHNKETLQRAEQIRLMRENNLNKPEIYTGHERELLRIKALGENDFVAYFKQLTDQRKASNHDNWVSTYNYLFEFTGGSLRFSDLNEKFCNDFKGHLLNTKSHRSNKKALAHNSAVSYFNKLKAGIKQAYKDGLLLRNLNDSIESIKPAETQRNFLTIDELNNLVNTECSRPLLKKVALFSALTGLRFCDIQNLSWGMIEYIKEDGYIIRFTQQKTKGVESLPISEQAYSLLGEPGLPDKLVFEGLFYSDHENKHLYQWIRAAGITKKITFHCFRHTFATLQLIYGTDIYTLSKLLGHRNLKNTQIYAKVVDRTKRIATNRIELDL
ncbi:MAG: site-specific integrase [Bacteroidales bacterium]|nr:site-specific integrase [Bacteroidales bacterium]